MFTKTGKIYPKFYKALGAACARLVIPYGRWIEDGLLLHTARHAVMTHLVEARLDFDMIGSITGHRAKTDCALLAQACGSVARAAAALEEMGRQRENGQIVDKKEPDPTVSN